MQTSHVLCSGEVHSWQGLKSCVNEVERDFMQPLHRETVTGLLCGGNWMCQRGINLGKICKNKWEKCIDDVPVACTKLPQHPGIKTGHI